MSEADRQVKLLGSETIYEGRVVRLRRDEIELPGGRRSQLEIVAHPGAAAIVPLDGEGRVLLVRQYRYAPGGRWLLEVPAGKLDPGEEPLACIAREIEEETGFRARRIERIGEIVTAPGFTDERIHLFEARDLEPGTLAHGSDEEIEVHRIPFARVLAMVENGEINDAKSVVGLYRARQRLRG